jgi:endoribonuclease Dicer
LGNTLHYSRYLFFAFLLLVDRYIYVCFLHSPSEEVLCLIFVERIMTAKAVERFMRAIRNFSRFSISYLTGGSTSKDALSPAVQRFTLDLFRAGKVCVTCQI